MFADAVANVRLAAERSATAKMAYCEEWSRWVEALALMGDKRTAESRSILTSLETARSGALTVNLVNLAVARLDLLEGETERAERLSRAVAEATVFTPFVRAAALAVVAAGQLARKDVEGADETALLAGRVGQEGGALSSTLSQLATTRAGALVALGRTDVARDILRQERERLRRLADSLPDAAARQVFLERVSENAAAVHAWEAMTS